MNIAHGSHDSPGEGACTMEHRYIRCQCPRCSEDKAAGRYTDRPRCSPRTLGIAMRKINDRLSDEARQAMACRIGLVPSILPGADPEVVARVERRVALWAARSVEHLGPPQAKACNDVTERYLAGDATEAELRAASWLAVWAAADALAAASRREARAAEAVVEPDALIEWLDRLLDVWTKTAADEGLMGDLAWLDDYCAVGGS